MPATADALARLADLVARRRAELRLSVNAAADLGEITNKTWKKVEDGLPVRAVSYAAVDSVLRWKTGSCQNVIDGGDPTLDSDVAESAPAGPRLVRKGELHDEWVPVVEDDVMRGVVRDAAMATIPGATAREIQDLERAVEEGLRRKLGLGDDTA